MLKEGKSDDCQDNSNDNAWHKGAIHLQRHRTSRLGIDATFDRDYLGRPYIDRSHIKGKLREALTELGADSSTIKKWLGGEGDRLSGNIFLSDFRMVDNHTGFNEIAPDLIHRIRMDEERGVVADNALIMFEELVKVNTLSEWRGELVFML